jgi:hypothetical protein
VEVPLCEESVNPGSNPGENRLDQRMPPKSDHRLLSPFRKKCKAENPVETPATEPTWWSIRIFLIVSYFMEGLFFPCK